jgi:predicted outer membrane repeat protein
MTTRMRLSVGLLALIAFCLGTVAAADAATINHRSIGTFKGVLFGTGTASVAKGDTAVTFEGGTIPANVGRGDEIVIDDEELHILSRDSDTRLTLQQPVKADHVDDEFAVRRAYTSIQGWVNDRNGNLVREDRLEVGVLYNDGPFTVKNGWVMAWIHGSRTDPEHFMWLTAAEGARHKGVAGTGVVLDGRDHTRTGLIVEDDYTRIDGIELKRFGHWLVPAAVTVRGAMGVVLERLIVHDFDTDRRRHETYGIKGGVYSSFTVRNCIIYDGGTAGIVARRRTADVEVENCTIYGMRGRGVDESIGRMSVVNTLSMGNAGGDFAIKRGTQSFNISSDGTAAGDRSLTFLHPVDQFVSVQKGLEDLHLLETADAIDAGKNLIPAATGVRASMVPDDDLVADPETVDIDGTDRSQETDWDVGADEVESAPAGVWYVDAAGSGDGRSWKSAFATLQQAVDAAAEGQEIWVRAGTYSLTSEIVVDKAITLLGGFAGNERKKEKRDPKTQPVVLSVASIGHAISLNAKNIQINGFVFRNANSANGGAVFAWPASSFIIGDSLFEGNRANFGGGLYAKNVNGAVIGCLFKDNSAVNKGGGIYTEGSSLRIMNCVFQNNVAGFSSSTTLGGGGVYVNGAGAEILNCTFFGNRTGNINSRGAAVHMFLAQARMANCIIAGDGTSTALSVHSFLPQNVIVQSCNIDQDEYGLSNPNGNINAPPLWVDPARGDFHLQSGSPCRDAGSDNAPGMPATDFDGNPRVAGAAVDMGAFEYQN